MEDFSLKLAADVLHSAIKLYKDTRAQTQQGRRVCLHIGECNDENDPRNNLICVSKSIGHHTEYVRELSNRMSYAIMRDVLLSCIKDDGCVGRESTMSIPRVQPMFSPECEPSHANVSYRSCPCLSSNTQTVEFNIIEAQKHKPRCMIEVFGGQLVEKILDEVKVEFIEKMLVKKEAKANTTMPNSSVLNKCIDMKSRNIVQVHCLGVVSTSVKNLDKSNDLAMYSSELAHEIMEQVNRTVAIHFDLPKFTDVSKLKYQHIHAFVAGVNNCNEPLCHEDIDKVPQKELSHRVNGAHLTQFTEILVDNVLRDAYREIHLITNRRHFRVDSRELCDTCIHTVISCSKCRSSITYDDNITTSVCICKRSDHVATSERCFHNVASSSSMIQDNNDSGQNAKRSPKSNETTKPQKKRGKMFVKGKRKTRGGKRKSSPDSCVAKIEEETKVPTDTEDWENLQPDTHLCCSVCLDVFYNPYYIKPCDHIFCEPCIRRWAKCCQDRGITQMCPVCRETISFCLKNMELTTQIMTYFTEDHQRRRRTDGRSKYMSHPLPAKPVTIDRERIARIVNRRNQRARVNPEYITFCRFLFLVFCFLLFKAGIAFVVVGVYGVIYGKNSESISQFMEEIKRHIWHFTSLETEERALLSNYGIIAMLALATLFFVLKFCEQRFLQYDRRVQFGVQR